MPVPFWQPGTLYLPGSLVRPITGGAVIVPVLANGSFEDGPSAAWIMTGSANTAGQIEQASPTFDGTWRAFMHCNENGEIRLMHQDRTPVVPGDLVSYGIYVNWLNGDDPRFSWLRLEIHWYTDAMVELTPTIMYPWGSSEASGVSCVRVWQQRIVEGIAPATAAFCSFTVRITTDDSDLGEWAVDAATISFASTVPPNFNIYKAVQAESGFSGSTEPIWPPTLGLTVVDNQVTWEAIAGNTVTWQAQRILVSGAVQPVWPLSPGGAVTDNTISWTLDSRRVLDQATPKSKMALIASSKIFSPDGDIINFSATVNPLDWTTTDDAGYLPFGLQNYGGNPVSAMGLYRSNVVAFNSQGCQIWQVDEDPAAMDLLDALPISCVFPKSVQPVGDDLAFLSSLGIRSLGLVGASINLQGGYFGKQVDALVVPEIANATANGWTPRGLYWPAQGQYWLFFGPQAFVLTINGTQASQRSWSRYTFPSAIDAWTLMGDELHLRSGNLVWRVDKNAKADDIFVNEVVNERVPFVSAIQWPHLDLGQFDGDKEMVGFDLAVDGSCTVSIGYDQTRPDYDADGSWTEQFPVQDDTVPGQMIPFSATGPSFALRLEFVSEQTWKWYSSNLYMKDLRG